MASKDHGLVDRFANFSWAHHYIWSFSVYKMRKCFFFKDKIHHEIILERLILNKTDTTTYFFLQDTHNTNIIANNKTIEKISLILFFSSFLSLGDIQLVMCSQIMC